MGGIKTRALLSRNPQTHVWGVITLVPHKSLIRVKETRQKRNLRRIRFKASPGRPKCIRADHEGANRISSFIIIFDGEKRRRKNAKHCDTRLLARRKAFKSLSDRQSSNAAMEAAES